MQEEVGSGPPVIVGVSALHQQGLFAGRGFQEGEVIMHEVPMVALQSLHNRQDVPVCGNCFAFVGSARQHLQLLAGKLDRQQGLGEADVEEKHLPGAVFSPVVPCVMGCGNLYCSVLCWEDHYGSKGHRLLCVGPVPEEEAQAHPLVRFVVHAVSTNEIFLLVADVIARVITIYDTNGGNLQAALQPFQDFVHLPWWDVAINPDPKADPQQFKDLLKSLCVESSGLLRQALGRPGLESLFEPVFFACVIGMFEQNNVGIRNRSALYPLLEGLRQQGAALDPQLAAYVHKAYLPCIKRIVEERGAEEGEEEEEGGPEEEEGGAGHCHGDGCGHDHNGEEGAEDGMMAVDDDDDDDEEEDEEVGVEEVGALLEACREEKDSGLFPPVDGTALYALICKMNHSCQPNCRVQYVGGVQQQPMQAQLVALTRIGPGRSSVRVT